MEQRKILFRGRCIDEASNGLWVYGNLIQGTDLEGQAFAQIECSDAAEFRQWNVDPSTVGQFTGLQDKQRRDIYEGDMIAINDFSHKYEVFHDEGAFRLRHLNPEMNRMVWGPLFRVDELGHEMIITGTIHDATKSPEDSLTEVKK